MTRSALIAAVVGVAGITAFAQAPVPAGSSYDSEAHATRPSAPTDQAVGNVPPGYGGYGWDPRSYVTDYPAEEVQAVPVAKAREVGAQWRMRQIQSDLYRTVDLLREDFQYSPELKAASDDEKLAYGNYINAKQQVLKRLQQDTTYRTMLSLSADLKKKIDDQRAPSDRPPTREEMERLMATASLRMSYASSASEMEAAAFEADGNVQDAKRKLVAAGDKVVAMRAAFDRKVRRDPEFASARKAFDEAELNYVVAAAFRESAVEAANIALRFAYYLHEGDLYNNHNGYVFGGGGYGYPYYGGTYYNASYNGASVRYGYTTRQGR